MNEAFEARKAIESLRAGVPNLSAVSALGVNHKAICETFEQMCEQLGQSVRPGAVCRGTFIEGNFGTGKSHTLRYLETIASKKRVPFSTVSISKETPLGDLTAVFRAAIVGLRFGDRSLAGTLGSAFDKIDPNEAAYAKLCDTVSDAGLDSVFLASLQLYRRYRADPETIEQLVDFWDGGPAQIALWKRLLQDVDDSATTVKASRAADLAPQRFHFAALVLVAAGYRGWCVAIDEIELIANFALKARAKAYESIAFVFGDAGQNQHAQGWFSIGAITEDLLPVLTEQRNDPAVIRDRFRWDPDLAASALVGLSVLSDKKRTYRLSEPTALDLVRAHDGVRKLYTTAYNYDASQAFTAAGIGSLSKSMRSYVREWIAFWDLKMQDDSYEPEIVSREVEFSLEEDEDLEEQSA